MLGGYAQTKWVCEQRLKAAASLLPYLRVGIYRLGMISADCSNGTSNLSDWLYRFVVCSILIGGYLINRASSLPVLNLTALDHASTCLLALISSAESNPASPIIESCLHQIPVSIRMDPSDFMQKFGISANSILQRKIVPLAKEEWARKLSTLDASNPLFPFKDTFRDGLGDISSHPAEDTVKLLLQIFQPEPASDVETKGGTSYIPN